MGCDVEDPGFGVLERRPDIDSAPRHFGSSASPQAVAIASKEPPTVSVADVNTAVESANNRVRSSPATDSGATRSTARVEPRLSSWSSHTTSVRSGIAGPKDARIRDAVSRDLGEAGDRLGARRGGLGVGGRRVDGRTRGAGRIAQRGEVGRQLVVEVVDATGGRVLDGRDEVGRCPFPSLHELRFDQPG